MKKTLLVTFALIPVLGFSQTNLVPNGTFEQVVEKKIKEVGMIEYATPWSSPTLAKADLYSPSAKYYGVTVPENEYGEEKPMEGKGYAGIIAYSYKNKVPRSYLQVQLTKKLEAGKEYCVKYHVSLADLSKYGCNHLGVAITDKAISANNSDVLKFDSYIESKRLKIYDKQFYWTPICGVFKAKGGEEFLTIGNFTENIDQYKDLKKVKRPRGFTKPQKYVAYYYIDNVSVVPVEEAKKCDCDIIPGMEDAEVIKSGFSSDKSAKSTNVKILNTDGTVAGQSSSEEKSGGVVADGKVDGIKIMFAKGQFSIKTVVNQLDKIVAYLKENIDEKVMLSGHIDESEKDIDKLAGRRVGAVYKYLISKGIAKNRVGRSIEGFSSPIDKKNISKNMRVEVVVEPI